MMLNLGFFWPDPQVPENIFDVDFAKYSINGRHDLWWQLISTDWAMAGLRLQVSDVAQLQA